MSEYTSDRPSAFVAMKFADGDHWHDKKYQAISEVLETAGYEVLRGDTIKTSGSVNDEVCRLLKCSDLVVIDTSEDSHNVSYELGYCHGVGRDPEQTILIRKGDSIPFNYRHYRHRVYRDNRHLKRLLRDYLDISEPILPSMLGYAFTFEFLEEARSGYIFDGFLCVMDALLQTGLTGRCECYCGEPFWLGGRDFVIGINIRLRGEKTNTPEYSFWEEIEHRVDELTSEFNGRIRLDVARSELALKSAISGWFPHCGTAEIRSGRITKIHGEEAETTFFMEYLSKKRTKG